MASSDSETVYEGRAGGELQPHQKLGHYEIQRKIGSGGMGVVYLANDSRLKRPVALKILPPDKALNPILVRRFRSEAEKVAQLRHENIVAIYDTGEVDGYSYMAMEYIEGTDLQKLLDVRKRIPFRRSLDIVKQVTRALAHANAISIVHRDIKPANLLIKRDGTVKLTDMGLARTMDDSPESGITRAGTTVGTIDYMSPEQARDSKSADTRSDLYSLGCTWYQMLTGEPPYPEGSLTNKLRAHAYSPVPDPRSLNPEVPEPIVAVVQRMMSKNPDDRYQSPDKLLDDLDNPNLLLEDVGRKIFSELDEEIPVGQSPHAVKASEPDRHAVIEREARTPDSNRKNKTGTQPSPDKGNHPGPKAAMGSPKSQQQRVLSRHERESQDANGLFWRIVIGSTAILVIGLVYFGVTQAWPHMQQHLFPASGRNQSNPLDERRAEHIPAAVPVAPQKPAGVQAAVPVKTPEKQEPAKSPAPMNTPASPAPVAPAVAATVPAGLSHLDALPEWVNRPASTSGLRVLSVGPGAASELRYPSINAAINALPNEGGVIEVAGDGPFSMAPAVVNQKHIILRSSLGTRPVVQLVPASQDPSSVFLSVSNGLLHLQGIDLFVQGESLKGTSLTHVLAVENSDLSLIDSSLTVLGSPEKPITAVKFQGLSKRASGAPQGLFLAQRFVLRGAGLAGVEASSSHADIVLRECLFTLADSDLFRVFVQSETADHAVAIRILESTLASRGVGFHLIAPEKGKVPGVLGILLQNSLISAPSSNQSVLLEAENWPKSVGSAGPLAGITWMVKKSTLLGWKQLQKMIPEDTLSTKSVEEWKKIWKQTEAEEQILEANWPSVPEAYSPLQPLNVWSRESLSGVSQESGQGCNITALSARSPADWNLVSKAAPRPVWNTVLVSVGEPISIDANRTDVGRKLAEREWPDGTTFKISGSGLRTSSPFSIKNRRLRLVFEGGGDAPLILSPRSNDFREKTSTSEQAFISIENGFLEIVGGKFSVSPNDRQHPDWFLKAEQGAFALSKTQFESPLMRESPLKGWIKWSGTPAKESQSLIADCVFIGGGTLVDATLNKRNLIIRNSLLASRDDLFLLQGAVRGGAVELGSLDLERCTLAAGNSFYRLSWPQTGQGKTLNVFADSCLYVPILQDPQRPVLPAVLANAEPMSLARVNWSENRCGYAAEISTFLSGWPIKDAVLKNVGDWRKQWGDDAVRLPLSNAGDIQFTEAGGPRGARMKLSHYQLKPQAQAASWGVGKLSIGIDLKVLEALGTSSISATNDASRSSSPAAPATPSKSPVKAQKSPGF